MSINAPVTPARDLRAALERLESIAQNPPCTRKANEYWNHQWSEREARAVQVALATRRPLLLRGEPGCGKTQLAKAVAAVMGWEPLVETVHPRMEPQDLLYRFDAVKRLARAHLSNTEQQDLDSPSFYEPGVLWKALDWDSAARAGSTPATHTQRPAGFVVCIDEIDKADADLPNSLLEVFGERQCALPCAPRRLEWPDPTDSTRLAPLVLITTNEDRVLPTPFLRRCVVLTLEVQASNPEWLVSHRGRAHFRTSPDDASSNLPVLDEAIMLNAALLLTRDRAGFVAAQFAPPGVAEYLDLLRALHESQQQLGLNAAALGERLNALAPYVYRKHAGEDVPAHLSQQPCSSILDS